MPTRSALSGPLIAGKHRLRSAGALGARSVGLAGIVLAGLVLLVALGAVRYERQGRLQDAIVFTELMTSVLEDHATRSVDTASVALAALAELVDQSELQSSTQLGWVLAQSLASQPVLREVAVIDERGLVLASTAPGNQNRVIDLARLGTLPPPGAEALGAFVRGRDLGALASDAAAAAAPSGVGFIPLVRQVATPGSRTLLLVGLINPDALANHQQQMLGDRGSSAALASYSGQVLAAHAGVPVTPGDSVAALPVFSRYLPGIEHGSFLGRGMGDSDQILAFRASRTRPMVVMVETPVAVALASWQRDARALGWAAAVVALVIVLLSQLAARSMHSRETARRQRDEAQGAVAARERELNVIVKSVQALLFRTDAQGRLTFVNARWQAASGYTEAAALGQSLASLVRPESEAAARRLFIHEGHDGVRTAELLMGSDASERRFDVAVAPLYAQGGIVGFAGSAVDVTAQRLVQGHLRAQLALTELLLDVLPVPMSILDCQGCYTSVNQAWQEFTGRQRQDVLGRPARSFRMPEEAEEHDRRDVELMARGGRIRYEARVAHHDGSMRDLVITKAAVPGPDGPITGILAAFMDVTEFREAERATRAARERAEQASLAKSAFLANMSHEIRTPLNAVLGMHRLLQNTDLKPGQSDLLGKANQAGLGLMDIINDVLDLAKIEAGEMSINTQPFQPRPLFEELMNVHGVVAQAKGLKLTLDTAAELPLWIVGDRFRLRQVLSNLLSNAIKFTTIGEVTLLTRVRREDSQPWVDLVVRDSGVGISEEAIGRLFNPFVQADESTTRQFGGTGLGLSIVRNLAQMMGGDAQVSSTLGVGSEFSITLPLVEADEDLVAQATRASRPIEVALMCADEDLCLNMRQRLTALGWSCFRPMSAETGEADVLLMDAALGSEGAVRLCEMVDASKAQGHDLPAILLGDAQELLAMQRLALPLHRLVLKPANMSSVFNTVVEVLARGEDSQDRLIGSTRAIEGGIQWLQGARILVVDDSEINLEVAVALLRQQGATWHTCVNGQEAVDWLLAHPDEADAVLMDVQMPVLDGLAATRLIKSHAAFKSLPVIALTAGALDSERLRAKAAGMDAFLTKPLEPLDVVKLLRSRIGLYRGKAPQVVLTQTGEGAVSLDPPASQPWPEIPGIDNTCSMLSLSNSVELFNKLLVLVQKNYSTWGVTWLELAQQKGPEINADLCASLHKLRGNAGMLGAVELAAVAKQAESGVLAGSVLPPEAVQRVAKVLDELLAHVNDHMSLLLPNETVVLDAGPLTQAGRNKLATLAGLLSKSDFDAIDLGFALRPELVSLLGRDDAEGLLQKVDGLDFTAAYARLTSKL